MSEITKALVKFQQEVGKIHKDATAQYGKYSDLSGVLSTINPVLNKHGLCIVQTFLDDALVTTLRHVSGEVICSNSKLIVTAGRNELHSWGASVTYTRRYQICSILGIVADMDMDGAMLEDAKPEPVKTAPKKTVTKKAAAPAPTPAPSANPNDQPLSSDDRQAVLAILKETFASEGGSDKIKDLTTKFRAQFKNVGDLPLSQAITTQAHVAFINEQL